MFNLLQLEHVLRFHAAHITGAVGGQGAYCTARHRHTMKIDDDESDIFVRTLPFHHFNDIHNCKYKRRLKEIKLQNLLSKSISSKDYLQGNI